MGPAASPQVGIEPGAAGLKSRRSPMQQTDRGGGPEGLVLMRSQKRPFVAAAARFVGPMTELRTFLPDADAAKSASARRPSC